MTQRSLVCIFFHSIQNNYSIRDNQWSFRISQLKPEPFHVTCELKMGKSGKNPHSCYITTCLNILMEKALQMYLPNLISKID